MVPFVSVVVVNKVRLALSRAFRHGFGCLTCFSLALALLTANSAEAAPRRHFARHLPAEATGLAPVDRLPGGQRLELSIGLPMRNQAEFDQLLEQIYDPASTNYQHYLMPAEFAERFGPTPEDYQAVIAFAQAQGLTVSRTFSNRTLIVVNGAVTNIEKAFQVNLRVFPHPTENRRFYAPDTEPSVDASVPDLDIGGLDNYVTPRPMNLIRKPADQLADFQATAIPPLTGSGPGNNFIGNDFRAAYAPGVTLTGTGQSGGIV